MEQEVWIDYTNHRRERAWRHIEPMALVFAPSEWHEGLQWLLLAWDLDKQAERGFALTGIHCWLDHPPSG